MEREEQILKLIDEENGIYNYGSCDYRVGVCDGVRLADKNPRPQTIAEYLYKEKGYPISLNGEILLGVTDDKILLNFIAQYVKFIQIDEEKMGTIQLHEIIKN